MPREVIVVDYGLGNLYSVAKALEYCEVTPIITGNPEVVRNAPSVLLPGVGAFGRGIEALGALGLDLAVREVVERGNKLLGICLGMQLLLDSSEEFGEQNGLGLIPGKVVAIPRSNGIQDIKVPHIGWNELQPVAEGCPWGQSPLHAIACDSAMYFVHSFMAEPLKQSHRVADCRYDGINISAAIGRDNVWGMQFHPEKSGAVGLRLLQGWIASP